MRNFNAARNTDVPMGMLPHGGGIEGGSADGECGPLNAERRCGSCRGVCMAKCACPVWIRKHQHNCAPGAAKQLPATQMPHAPIAGPPANRPPPTRRANPGFGVPPRTPHPPRWQMGSCIAWVPTQNETQMPLAMGLLHQGPHCAAGCKHKGPSQQWRMPAHTLHLLHTGW